MALEKLWTADAEAERKSSEPRKNYIRAPTGSTQKSVAKSSSSHVFTIPAPIRDEWIDVVLALAELPRVLAYLQLKVCKHIL